MEYEMETGIIVAYRDRRVYIGVIQRNWKRTWNVLYDKVTFFVFLDFGY